MSDTFVVNLRLDDTGFGDDMSSQNLGDMSVASRLASMVLFNKVGSGKVIRMWDVHIRHLISGAVSQTGNANLFDFAIASAIVGGDPMPIVPRDSNIPAPTFVNALFGVDGYTISRSMNRVATLARRHVTDQVYQSRGRYNVFERVVEESTEVQPITLRAGETFMIMKAAPMIEVPLLFTFTFNVGANTYTTGRVIAPVGDNGRCLVALNNPSGSTEVVTIHSVDIQLANTVGTHLGYNGYPGYVGQVQAAETGSFHNATNLALVDHTEGGTPVNIRPRDSIVAVPAGIECYRDAYVDLLGKACGATLTFPIISRRAGNFIPKGANLAALDMAPLSKVDLFSAYDRDSNIVLREGYGICLYYPTPMRFGESTGYMIFTVENDVQATGQVARAFA